MITSNEPFAHTRVDETVIINNGSSSAVSWPAVFAGATVAAAVSLILLVLGTGLGLSAVSPWSNEGITATTFGVSTILWITAMALVSSALGGYIAGRLRNRWAGTHYDEVFFRDTAHGFLAWSLATIGTAVLLASTIAAIISGGASLVAGGAKAGAAVVGGMTVAGTQMASQMNNSGTGSDAESNSNVGGMLSYYIDRLFRATAQSTDESTGSNAMPASQAIDSQAPSSQTPGSQTNTSQTNKSPVTNSPTSTGQPSMTASPTNGASKDRDESLSSREMAQVSTIFVRGLSQEEALSDDDVDYLAGLIAERTDLSQAEAKQRIEDTYTRVQQELEQAKTEAKEAAEKAKKASAYASLWIFVSLLVGAFSACYAATWGGRQRDL